MAEERRLTVSISGRAMTSRFANLSLPGSADRPLLGLRGTVGTPITRRFSLALDGSLDAMRDSGALSPAAERLIEKRAKCLIIFQLRGHRAQRRQALSDGQAAHLIAITCSKVPDGHDHWTVRMLAGQAVELGYVRSISPETVRQLLKKTRL